MNFLCSCCKQRITKNQTRIPTLIESAGIHDIGYRLEWMECEKEDLFLPVNERKWGYSDQIPVIGEKRILKITKPFDEEVGDLFTALFEPWNLFDRDWDLVGPEEIDKACAVLCRFDEVLWSDDFSAFIVVKVMNTVRLDLLHTLIPAEVTDYRFYEEFGRYEEVWTEYEDARWLCREWSGGGGDIGEEQWIYTDDRGIRHEVLTGWYDFHEDFYSFRNVVNNEIRLC